MPVYAARQYEPGDLISCSPRAAAHAVGWKSKFILCDNCLTPEGGARQGTTKTDTLKSDEDSAKSELELCGACRAMAYCSEQCQSEDWNTGGHKWECPIYAKHLRLPSSDGSESASEYYDILMSARNRLLLRLWLLGRNVSGYLERQEQMLFRGIKRGVADCTSHEEEFRLDREWMEAMDKLSAAWTDWKVLDPHDGTIFNKDLLISLMGKICTNAFCLGTAIVGNQIELKPSENEVDTMGLYPCEAVFDHACRPVAGWTLEKTSFRVRALTCIRPGQEVSISYTNLMRTTTKRRISLLNNFHFFCQCARCMSEDDHLIDPLQFNSCLVERYEREWSGSGKPRLVSIYEHISRLGCLHQSIVSVMESIESECTPGHRELLGDVFVDSTLPAKIRLLKGALVSNLEIIRCIEWVMSRRSPPGQRPALDVEWYDQSMELLYFNACSLIRGLHTAHADVALDPKRSQQERDATRLSDAELEAMLCILCRGARALAVILGTDHSNFHNFVEECWSRVMGRGVAGELDLGVAISQWMPPDEAETGEGIVKVPLSHFKWAITR